MTTYNGSSQHEPRRSGDEGTRVVEDDDAQGNNNQDTGLEEKTVPINPETDLYSKDVPLDTCNNKPSLEDMMIEKDERTVSSSSPCLVTTTTDDINANLAVDDVSFMTTNAPLKFIRRKSKRTTGRQHYVSVSHNNLRNSLLPLVGFLELANAGDFAANVFNTIPVPTFAAVLMGIGGCVALCFCTVAIWDARLSFENVKILRRERQTLLSLRRHLERQQKTTTNVNFAPSSQNFDINTEKSSSPTQPLNLFHHHHHLALSVYLDVNTFETRTELVDRLLMDITMGFGALLVGVGTLMAIAGANHKIFLASNLLSGYIGNGPAALYGLIRAVWSMYVYIRTTRHERAVRKSVTATLTTPEITQALRQRYTRLKFYASLAGPTSLVAGAASLVTATMWWGYTMLAPCIVLSWVCNTLYRKEIGYTRPIVQFPANFGDDEEQQQASTTAAAATVIDRMMTNMNEQVLLKELNEVVVMRKSFEFAKKQTSKTTKRRTTTLDNTSTATTTTTTTTTTTIINPASSPSVTFGILTKLNLVETFFLNLTTSLSLSSLSGSSSSPPGSEEQKWAKRILLSDVSFTIESRVEPTSRPCRPGSISHQGQESSPSSSSPSSSSSSSSSTPPPPPFPPWTRTIQSGSEPELDSEQESPPPPPFREVEPEGITNVGYNQGGTDTNIDTDDDDDDRQNEDENDLPDTITIHDPNSLLAASLFLASSRDITTERQRQQHRHFLLGLANSTVSNHGLLSAKYRERYTVEYLGCLTHRLCQGC
ncbi:hypothetical protein H2204_011275 [Knufia peltigerae]|uniref:Integral membrane protein n=1 Tax=Knufia peltigerae TaxID=1002370 RepID=A0AA38XVI4_9EURO|nr:hypothetical protein H2204_011275 [Knufia peltigerae]